MHVVVVDHLPRVRRRHCHCQFRPKARGCDRRPTAQTARTSSSRPAAYPCAANRNRVARNHWTSSVAQRTEADVQVDACIGLDDHNAVQGVHADSPLVGHREERTAARRSVRRAEGERRRTSSSG